MSYGSLKVDTITYTSGGGDVTSSVSGLANALAGNFPNISITGTISGTTITGDNVSFTNVTGVSGTFADTLSGATITGDAGQYGTITAITGVFTDTLSGATISGDNVSFTNVTGVSGTFTDTLSGTTITGDNVSFTNVTGVSGTFTDTLSGATVTGDTGQYTTITAVTGIFTSTLSGATITGQTIEDSIGNVRDIPQNTQTGSYTLVASDAGKHVFTTAGVTVPSGVFVVGEAVSIYNNTTGDLTITQGSNVTMYQAGASGATGNRTLAERGLATVLCVSGANGTEFVIAGAGLS